MKKYFSFLLLIFIASTAFGENCDRVRVAFDIGSGSTRMVVAKVNSCKNRVEKILKEEERAVLYKLDLDQSPDQRFSKKIKKLGLDTMLELKEIAKKYNPNHYVAVSTEAFRMAKNADQYIEELKEALDMIIYIIPQEKEGTLGFLSALHQIKFDGNKVSVWDIGAGSMQITMVNDDYDFKIYLDKLGSETFKNFILETIKGLNHKKVISPNPIGAKGSKLALNFSQYYAENSVPEFIKNKIKNTRVIGIGGVHFWSIRNLLNKKSNDLEFTTKEIEKAIKKYKDYDDKKVGGKFAHTDVSNLILVLGYMNALEIKKVTALNITMGHGILLDREFWSH